MRLSLAFEMQRPVLDDHAVIEDTLQQCILADEMGFDTVWFVEHHFLTSFSMSPCPEVIFGALSRLTKRIRLGFGVVILPYHHPVRVAERGAQAVGQAPTRRSGGRHCSPRRISSPPSWGSASWRSALHRPPISRR